ncbi:hypothetical protein SETIT_3G220800v2 [Setaria italica]|uniref:CCHC-type domain-containing protein n=1 Tax=Setaria italica TaxID=4555 RepID=A0A368QHM2_SETIT|nr:hypothetical protein SETIT_3G220800v2 [Setaria italica]
MGAPGKVERRTRIEDSQEGHHQALCTNDPLCFRCKTSGHVASQCPQMQIKTFARSKGVELALHNLSAKVSKSTEVAAASSILQMGWVKIYDIPSRARNQEVVKLIAELAGEVVIIDELSLIRVGPVRVKLNGRNINKLRGFVEIFFGKVGREIRFVAEGAIGQVPPKDPPPRKLDEDTDEEEEESKQHKDGNDETKQINDMEEEKREQGSNEGTPIKEVDQAA